MDTCEREEKVRTPLRVFGEGERMKKKILVVDNHPLMLTFMSQLLGKEGHQVLTADNGLSALEILKTFTPEIIFIDLIMPHISGEKLCQIIRKMPSLKEAYLIILSAIAAEQEVDYASFGADACIAKGSLDKMAKHVLASLALADRKTGASPPAKIIGIEEVYARNITRELLSVKKHFEVILNSMVEGIFEITPQGKIVYTNPQAIALTNRTEDQLLSSDFLELFLPSDRPKIKEILHQASRASKPQPVHVKEPLIFNEKPIALCLLPILEETQRSVIVILTDLSEQKRMEAQLLQSQKMEAIGTLAGGIAHDFNNLLMVIQGNASLMLLDMDTSHPHYAMVKMIEKQVQSGSQLTAQLLGYARKGRYELRPIDLNQLIINTSEIFWRTRKNITLHRNLAENLLPCEADQSQIEQVLMNLLVNAADAMPEGGDLFLTTTNVKVSELAGKEDPPKPGDYVLLTVSDQGVGMDPETLHRIFDPFFTTKQGGRGTGLGLAATYGIVKGHGGFIEVESQKGHGSTFKIYLPVSTHLSPPQRTSFGLSLKPAGKILLVDDEEVILEVGEKILKTLGYQPLVAKGGIRAVEIFKEHHQSIDLVILDIIMPQMNGGEVYDRLKEISPEVKVLLSSGYSLDGEASNIMAKGCDGFIQKPFDIEQLAHSIKNILGKV